MSLFDKLLGIIHGKPKDEPEYQEEVEHDIVMKRVGDEFVEVTGNDPEVRE